MENLYSKNGLLIWTQEEIKLREQLRDRFILVLEDCLKQQNRAFEFIQCEASILTPKELINPNYTNEDIYCIDELVLRPETTMGSYEYAKYILGQAGQGRYKFPLVVWQYGKSFRKEQDQATKFMRLKEFYQLEFQILYSDTTQCDYADKLIPQIKNMIGNMIGECYIGPSDRLPDYSEKTIDVICRANEMEVCSISKRKDYEGAKNLEVAIGMDRCVYNFLNK